MLFPPFLWNHSFPQDIMLPRIAPSTEAAMLKQMVMVISNVFLSKRQLLKWRKQRWNWKSTWRLRLDGLRRIEGYVEAELFWCIVVGYLVQVFNIGRWWNAVPTCWTYRAADVREADHQGDLWHLQLAMMQQRWDLLFECAHGPGFGIFKISMGWKWHFFLVLVFKFRVPYIVCMWTTGSCDRGRIIYCGYSQNFSEHVPKSSIVPWLTGLSCRGYWGWSIELVAHVCMKMCSLPLSALYLWAVVPVDGPLLWNGSTC